MAASPRNGPGTCFKTQSYEIQGNPCNHCGGHAFWMTKGALAAAKKVAASAAAAKSAAAAAVAKKRKTVADTSSDSDGDDELVSNTGSELGPDDQTTVTDESLKVKGKTPRKSAVIPRCDFIFVLLSKPKS